MWEIQISQFFDCEKLQSIVLSTQVISLSIQSCRGLQRIAGTGYLTKMCISNCPELEELPTLYSWICLEELKIFDCGKLQNIVLPKQVMSLSVECCRGLQRIAGMGDLTKITNLYIYGCRNLEGVSGIFELKQLYVNYCPELEELPTLYSWICLEELKIFDCDKLRNIVLPTQVMSLSVECCRGLQRITGMGDLTKITNLYIDGCQNLEGVSGIFELKQLYVSYCPELKELPTLSRQSYLENFVINSCQKVKNIGGTEELQVLKYMRLSCLSRAAFRDCMAKLKIVPPSFIFAIRGAVEGAKATSNQCQFALQKIGVRRLSSITNESCVTVVNCFAVVIPDYRSGKHVNDALSKSLPCDSMSIHLHWLGGECIITVVDRDDRSEEIKRGLSGLVKKWYRVFVKEDEEWKIRQMVPAIAELAMSGMESKLGQMFFKLLK